MKSLELAAILAGGTGRRMGRDKVVVPLGGKPMIERVWEILDPIAKRVAVVGGLPRLDQCGVPTVPDRYPGADSMGGLATALHYARETLGPDAWALCVACDMPLLQPGLLSYMGGLLRAGVDVVVPRTALGYEPLCAFYRVTCLPSFEEEIARENLRIFDIFRRVRVREVGEAEVRSVDPDLRSFLNVNRPEDLVAAARLLEEGIPTP